MQQDPVILVREGKSWRQYLVITNERVAIVHMTPAELVGWNIHHVDIQGPDEWPGMTREAIVSWKAHTDDGHTRHVTATELGNFHGKLLASAGVAS
jgi:hypothetical protein